MNEQFLALIFGVLPPNQKGLPILFTKHVEFGEFVFLEISKVFSSVRSSACIGILQPILRDA